MSTHWVLAERDRLAALVVERQYAMRPELASRYGPAGRVKCLEDARFHFLYLAEAVAQDEPILFQAYVEWGQELLEGLGIPVEDLVMNLEIMAEVVANEPEGAPAEEIVRAAIAFLQHPDRSPDAPRELEHSLAQTYLDELLAFNRGAATTAVQSAMASGTDIESIYLDVFQPVLREVGRRWQANELTVATEHYCTAVTQSLMARMAGDLFAHAAPHAGRAMFACVGDELHQVGLRMVADLAELDGWNTSFLGANVPAGALLTDLVRLRPKALALSVTFTPNLRKAEEIIRAARATPELKGMRILVGGYPFLLSDGLWRRIGADGFGRDAREARSLLAASA